MKRLKYILIALAIILLVAFITKPSDETCRQKAVESLRGKTIAKTGENDLMQKMIDLATEKGLYTRDKGLYKTIHFKFGKSDKKIGWAAFGMVNIQENKE